MFLAAEEITYEDNTSEYVVLDLKFLDPNQNRAKDEIQTYEQWLNRFKADVGLVDYGYGTQAMESLQNGDDTVDPDGYMDTVSASKFGNVKDRTDIKWTEDEDGRVSASGKEFVDSVEFPEIKNSEGKKLGVDEAERRRRLENLGYR